MQARALDRPRQEHKTGESVVELCNLAATGLVAMLDPERQLFCYTYARTEGGMKRQGLSHRYTMMTLLGLHRFECAGRKSPMEIAPILDALIRDTKWIASTGDLGLLLWCCAEIVPDRLPQIYEQAGAREALARFSDGQEGCTMEVAWYLTGLAACGLAGHHNLPGQAEQIAAARRILVSNCGHSGIYGHLANSKSLKRNLRRRIGSFADQVYPTIAFACLSQALNDAAARKMADQTARTMCRLQGPQGEWSWHYDSSNGKVVSRYPVYSVHQHAMAPMMLFAAAEATGANFDEAIYKGLDWVYGNNELHRNFVEPVLNLVWRCIYLRRTDALLDSALRTMKLRNGASGFQPRVRYECRPYELGWLLYAFADQCRVHQAA